MPKLPPLDQPIPSDFNHLHFGAGQTEAEVTLPQGEHTLQLAARRQEPRSEYRRRWSPSGSRSVSSPPARRPRQPASDAPTASSAGRHKSPPGAKVYFVYPTNRGYVTPTPVVRFGLIGMGVAPAGFEKVNTGHHHLLVDTELPRVRPADPERLQPSAFRRRPDRSQDHAADGQAYVAVAAGRREPCPARSADFFGADFGDRQRQRAVRPAKRYRKHRRYY